MAWLYKGTRIREIYCFKPGKKCTPDCPSYDVGNYYLDDKDEEITEILE